MTPHIFHIHCIHDRRSNPQALFSVYAWSAVMSMLMSNCRETYVLACTKFIKDRVGQIRYAPGATFTNKG